MRNQPNVHNIGPKAALGRHPATGDLFFVTSSKKIVAGYVTVRA